MKRRKGIKLYRLVLSSILAFNTLALAGPSILTAQADSALISESMSKAKQLAAAINSAAGSEAARVEMEDSMQKVVLSKNVEIDSSITITIESSDENETSLLLDFQGHTITKPRRSLSLQEESQPGQDVQTAQNDKAPLLQVSGENFNLIFDDNHGRYGPDGGLVMYENAPTIAISQSAHLSIHDGAYYNYAASSAGKDESPVLLLSDSSSLSMDGGYLEKYSYLDAKGQIDLLESALKIESSEKSDISKEAKISSCYGCGIRVVSGSEENLSCPSLSIDGGSIDAQVALCTTGTETDSDCRLSISAGKLTGHIDYPAIYLPAGDLVITGGDIFGGLGILVEGKGAAGQNSGGSLRLGMENMEETSLPVITGTNEKGVKIAYPNESQRKSCTIGPAALAYNMAQNYGQIEQEAKIVINNGILRQSLYKGEGNSILLTCQGEEIKEPETELFKLNGGFFGTPLPLSYLPKSQDNEQTPTVGLLSCSPAGPYCYRKEQTEENFDLETLPYGAIWTPAALLNEPCSFNVVYNPNGGNIDYGLNPNGMITSNETIKGKVIKGSILKLPEAFVSGYRFLGWEQYNGVDSPPQLDPGEDPDNIAPGTLIPVQSRIYFLGDYAPITDPEPDPEPDPDPDSETKPDPKPEEDPEDPSTPKDPSKKDPSSSPAPLPSPQNPDLPQEPSSGPADSPLIQPDQRPVTDTEENEAIFRPNSGINTGVSGTGPGFDEPGSQSIEIEEDQSSITFTQNPDGSKAATTKDTSGLVTSAVITIPVQAVSNKSAAVSLGSDPSGKDLAIVGNEVDQNKAAALTINLPEEKTETFVTIPIEKGTLEPGTIALIEDEKGSLKPVIKTRFNEESSTLTIPLQGSQKLVILNQAISFPDSAVQPLYAQRAAAFVSARALMTGVGEKMPKPFDYLAETSRGQFATILYRLQERPEAFGPYPEGVEPGVWNSEPARWMVSQGYMAKGGSSFNSSKSITREQIAAILYRMQKAPAASPSLLDAYSDQDEISNEEFKKAMAWGIEKGIIGQGTKELKPGNKALRAEIAAMIERMIETQTFN